MKQNKKKIGLVLSSAVAASGAVCAALVGLASCSNNTTVPVGKLVTENGLVTSSTLTETEKHEYATLLIPERDANGAPITGIAKDAFKNAFTTKKYTDEMNISQIVLKKNVKKIGANAFLGCNTINTIDLSDYESIDDLMDLFSDTNMGDNAFAVSNTRKEGTLKLNSKLSSADVNKVKTALVASGLPMNWFATEDQPTISEMTLKNGSETLTGKKYYADQDSQTWDVMYGSDQSVAQYCTYSLIPQSLDFPTDKITVTKDADTGHARVKWTNTLEPGNYLFCLKAVYVRGLEETTLKAVTNSILLTVADTKYTIDGPLAMSGKNFKPGTSTDVFTTHLDSTKVASDYNIVESSSANITIDNNGAVSWDQLKTGFYYFKVKATYNLRDSYGNITKLSVTSDKVTLTITDRTVVITNATFPADLKELQEGYTTKPFEASVVDNSYNSTKWTLNFISGPSQTALKMTDEYPGYVYWGNDIPYGEYKFTVTANVDDHWYGTSQIVTVQFGQKAATIDGGEISLQSYDYTAGSGKTRTMKVDGRIVSNATWSIESTGTLVPAGIKINDQGQITWDESLAAGTYKFKVKAHTSDFFGHERSAYQEVTLEVGTKVYTISGGSSSLKTDEYQDGYDKSNWVANAPTSSNAETVEWSLESADGKQLPSGLTIDSDGRVRWSNSLPDGQYKFYVCALVNKHWHGKTSKAVTLDVAQRYLKINDDALPSTIQTKDYTSGTTSEKAIVNLIGANTGSTTDVTSSTKFSLVNQGEVGLPTSLKVTQDGKITWGDDIAATEPGKPYKFTISAQYEYHGRTITTTSTKVITLEVTAVDIQVKQSVKKASFAGDINAAKVDKSTKFTVEKDSVAYTQPVQWHFTNKTGETPILENKIRITDEGYLSWDAIPAGTYKFYVWCEVENKWWGYLHDTSTTGLEITLTITDEHDLTNSDLVLDNDKNVIGLSTDISGYKTEHSLTINVDGTNVAGIKSLTDITNNKLITSLVINSDVTLTLDGEQSSPMFGLANLKSIKIVNNSNDKVVSIGQYAFPNSIFASCTTLNLNGVTIGEQAFSTWSGLTKVTLTSVPKIGTSAFLQAGASTGMTVEGLNEILAKGSTTELGNGIFASSTISHTGDLSIERTIPEYTFSGCTLLASDIVIPDNTQVVINGYAFANSAIKTVKFGSISSKVNEHAFDGCLALSKLSFNSRITYIGASAFSGCSALKTIDVSSIDAGDLPSTKYQIATLANDMDANAFSGMPEGGTFLCKDQNTAATFKENLYSRMPTWLYTNNGAWQLTNKISSDITLSSSLPQLVRFDQRLYIPYTVAPGKQVVPAKSRFIINGHTYSESRGGYMGIAEICYGHILLNMPEIIKLEEPKEKFSIQVIITTQDEETLEYSGSKELLAEQSTAESAYVTYLRGIKVNDKVNIDNLSLDRYFKKAGKYFDKTNIDVQIVNVDKAAGTFDIKVSINKDSVGTGGFILDGYIRIADRETEVYWDIADLKIGVDYYTTFLKNSDFTVDANGTITGLNTALANNCYYDATITLDGTTYKNLGSQFLKTVNNGNMIDSITIINKAENTADISLTNGMFDACTDLRHIKLINENSVNTKFKAVEAFLPDECKADMLDIEVDNVSVAFAFKDFDAVTKVVIGKGTYLGEDSFENMYGVELLDLSSWDAVPTGTAIWHQDSFVNFALSLTTTHKMKVKNQQMMENWTAFFKNAPISGIKPEWWDFYW